MVIRRRVLSESHNLPIFAPEDPFAHICKDNARIDHFEIRYPSHKLQYINPNALSYFVQELSRGEGFASLGRNTNRYNAVRFSNDVLLSGKKIYFNHRGGDRAATCSFPIVINANYNRFYQANNITGCDGFELEDGQNIELEDDILELFDADNPTLAEARGLTLDGEDNILLRLRWREVSDVLTLLPLQIRLCQQFIESQFDLNSAYPLNNAPIANGRVSSSYLRQAQVVPIFDWTNYSIPHLEVYWDFQCSNAIAVAKQYEHPMRQITTQMRTRYHQYEMETNNNLVSHSAKLIDNVKLSIYAKTRTRIRFEVVYFQKSLKSILNTQLRGVDDMRGIIDCVLDDATAKLTRFIRAMQRHNTPGTVDRAETMAYFVKHIYQSTGGTVTPYQENMLDYLFSIISHSGRIIIEMPYERGLIPILEYLEHHEIMRRVNRRQGLRTRTYTFTEQYEWLLRAIMGN